MRTASRTETAHYIATMTANLTVMARASDLPFVAYLLGMAHSEAHSEATREGNRIDAPPVPVRLVR